MKKLNLFLFFIFFSMNLGLYLTMAEPYSDCSVYGNCEPISKPAPINYSMINVSNADYWNGNPWSDTRWLNIDGSNANQEIDLGDYGILSKVSTFGNSSDNVTLGINGYYGGGVIYSRGDIILTEDGDTAESHKIYFGDSVNYLYRDLSFLRLITCYHIISMTETWLMSL